MNIDFQAQHLLQLYHLELIDLSGMIEWADKQIIETIDPHVEILNLSISTNINDAINSLNNLSTKEIENQVYEYICTETYEEYSSKKIDFWQTINRILILYYKVNNLSQDNMDFCNWLDDETALVSEGVKDQQNAENILINYLKEIKEKDITKSRKEDFR